MKHEHMIDISKDLEKEKNDKLNWRDIEVSPDVNAIHQYESKERSSASIPTSKNWSLRNDEAHIRSSRSDAPYFKKAFKEADIHNTDSYIERLSLLNEKNWKYKVPISLAKKFAKAIHANDPDFEEIRGILKAIIEFVRDVVGEDDFYEDSLLEDIEFADLETEEDVDYYIDEMYDVLDGYDVWMEPASFLVDDEEDFKESRIRESTWTVEIYNPKTGKTIEKKSGFGSDYAACEYGDHTLEDLEEQGIEADYDTFEDVTKDHEDIINDENSDLHLATDDRQAGQWYESKMKESTSRYKALFKRFLEGVGFEKTGPFAEKNTPYSDKGFKWESQTSKLICIFDPETKFWYIKWIDYDEPEYNIRKNGKGFNNLIQFFFDLPGSTMASYSDEPAEYYFEESLADLDESKLKEGRSLVTPGSAKEILELLFYKTNEIFKDEIESVNVDAKFDVNTGDVSLYEVIEYKDSDWPIITTVEYNTETEEYNWESKADYPEDYDGHNGVPFWAAGDGEGWGQLLEDLADELGIRGVEKYVDRDLDYHGKYKESYAHKSKMKEANPISNKLSLALNDFLMDMAQGYVEGLGYKEIISHNYSKEDIATLNKLRRKCEAEDGDEDFITEKVVPEIKRIFNLSKKVAESYVHEVLDDADMELQKAKKSNEMYDTVDVEDRISVAQGHIRKAEMMVESKKEDIKYLKYLLRKEKVTALDDEERWELQDLISKYGYPEEYDESKLREAKDFDVDAFEAMIPHNMRYKVWEDYGDLLYWVTQEDFSNDDLETFQAALKGTPFKNAYVIVRDYSSYNKNEDVESDMGYLVPASGSIF